MQRHTRFAFAVLVCVLLLAGLVGVVMTRTRPADTTDALAAIRAHVAAAGNYRLSADIEQTLVPRALPGMAGARDQRLDWRAEGKVQLPDTSQIELRSESDAVPPLTLVQHAGRSFVQQNGVLAPSEAGDNLAAPSLDLLGYLDAASDVRPLPPETRDGQALTGFGFSIEGGKLAEQVRARMQRQLQAQLPEGSRLAPSELLQNLRGSGEIWLDARGLPIHQTLRLAMPKASDTHDARITIDATFRDWGALDSIGQPLQGSDGTWQLHDVPASSHAPPAASDTGMLPWLLSVLPTILLPLVVGVALLALLGVVRRNLRRSYFLTAVVVSLLLIAQPLLLPGDVGGRRAHAAAAAADREQTRRVDAALDAHAQRVRQAQTSAANCGLGSRTADTDQDGTSDFVEGCIGTDVDNADTDLDGITDTLELQSFTFGGKTWNSDPFKADTNADGLVDAAEWPAPIGEAPNWDIDNDTIPNLWDDDNDGDGVPDGQDLAPYSATTYSDTFQLETTATANQGYQYFEVQIRPQNPNHLRYTTSALDWPDGDNKGQITDLDGSTDDMRLVPLLEVTTDTVPELRQRYGLSVITRTNELLFYAPLYPVADNGQIVAFAGKVVYSPKQIGKVRWNTRLIWMPQTQVDSYTKCADPEAPSATSCQIATQTLTPHIYRDAFQVAGLSIRQSSDVKVGLFSTPQRPLDDSQLFNIAFGLNATYLRGSALESQPTLDILQALNDRFASPNLPPDQKFGVTTPVAFDYKTYGHTDEAVAAIGETALPNLLNANFRNRSQGEQCRDANGVAFACGAVLTAMEETSAAWSLDDAGGGTALSPAVAVNLSGTAFVPVVSRVVRYNLYEYLPGDNRWQALSTARVLDAIDQRGNLDADVRALIAAEPDYAIFDADDFRFMTYAGYLSWLSPKSTVMQLGPVKLFPAVTEAAIASASFWMVKSVSSSFPIYLLKFAAAELFTGAKEWTYTDPGDPKKQVSVKSDLTGLKELINKVRVNATSDQIKGKLNTLVTRYFTNTSADIAPNAKDVRLNVNRLLLNSVAGFSRAAMIGAAVLAVPVAIARIVCSTAAKSKCDEWRLKTAEDVTKGILLVSGTLEPLAKATDAYLKGGVDKKTLFNAKDLLKFRKYGPVVKGLLVVGVLLDIALTWTQFGLTVNSGPSFAWKIQLGFAIVMTAVTILLFVLSLIPGYDVLVALFQLIDWIVNLATGGKVKIIETAVRGIVRYFYDAEVLTQLSDVAFTKQRLEFSDPLKRTFVVGNGFTFGDRINSTFKATEGSVYRAIGPELAKSTANASFSGELPAGGGTIVDVNGPASCTANKQTATCANDVAVQVKLEQARRDFEIKIKWALDFTYRFRETYFFGYGTYSVKDEAGRLPAAGESADDYTFSLYFDVLPDTLDGLWSWNVLKNPDGDGDGLPTASERQLGTAPNNWDSDGDGLSDSFENEQRQALGTDPLKADSDNDGLTDRQELRLGTSVNVADSDGDGLSDGEEVFHKDATGQWAGGWNVALPGAPERRVFSDPLRADADADGLNDRMERDSRLSPYAANEAPLLTLDVAPMAQGDAGKLGSYLKPGDPITVTLNLLSSGASPITSTLSVCLPAFLTNVGGGVLTRGSGFAPARQGPTAESCGTRVSWSFAEANKLLLTDEVTATFTALVNSTQASSISGNITAELPYAGKLINPARQLVVDVDDPQVAISAPAPGAVLTGKGSTLIVGGSSSDATSWVQGVEVQLGAGAPFTRAEGAEQWAVPWTLPAADGIQTITARSRDAVGRVSSTSAITVVVDNTPPQVTSTLADRAFVTGLNQSQGTVLLSGTASDNLSGLGRLEISIDRRPWQPIALPTSFPLNHSWNYTWKLDPEKAQGQHLVALRAYDRAGLASSVLTRNVVVDLVPPGDTLIGEATATNDLPILPRSRAIELEGFVDDAANAPLPVRPGRLLGNTNALSEATIWLDTPYITDTIGMQVAWLGDTNGDGLGDLAVGLPNAQNGAGRVVIVYGRGGNWAAVPSAEALSSSPTMLVGVAGAGIGAKIAPAGDLNGDGLFDLLIGDARNNRVFVVYGNSGPLGRGLVLNGASPGVWSLISGSSDQRIGTWQNSAGDVNGDGADDLLLGATPGGGGSGQAYLLLGQSPILGQELSLKSAAATLPYASQGGPLSGVGDVTGDKLDDLVVSEPQGGANTLALYSGVRANGARITLPLTTRFTTGGIDNRLAALGDVNGDDLADFAFGSAAGPQLVLGRASGAWGVSRTLSGYNPPLDGFLAAPGDINADGLDDILIGSTSTNAYLLLGATTIAASAPAVQATLTGVAAAASTPYAAGADLNCDRSSDLLLVPQEAVSPGYLPQGLEDLLPPVALDRLPVRVRDEAVLSQQSATQSLPTSGATVDRRLFVDDDYCATCANDGLVWDQTAFSSVARALFFRYGTTEIVLRAGVYPPVELVDMSRVTILGENPDAVFIDGGGTSDGIKLTRSSYITIRNLTIRNTINGVTLSQALVGYGTTQPADKTTLDNLLIYGYRDNAVRSDRQSPLEVRRSTLSGSQSSGPAIFVDPNNPDPSYTPSWETDLAPPLPVRAGGGQALFGTPKGRQPTVVVALLGNGDRRVLNREDSYNLLTTLPFTPGPETTMTGGSDALYVGSGSRLYRFKGSFSGGTWDSVPVVPFGAGASLSYSASVPGANPRQLAVVVGGGPELWYYNADTLAGRRLALVPERVGTGTATAMVNGDLYLLAGGGRGNFYRYVYATDRWQPLAAMPVPVGQVVGAGAGLVWTGPSYRGGDFLYATQGGGSGNFYRYRISANRWEQLPSLGTPGNSSAFTMGAGGGLINLGALGNFAVLLATAGGGSTATQRYTYLQTPPTKLTISNTAFVAAASRAAPEWRNPSLRDTSVYNDPFPYDYPIAPVGSNRWVGGVGATWSPSVPTTATLTLDAARFADPARNLFRLRPSSSLTVGYAAQRSDAVVSPLFCAGCANEGLVWNVTAFSSIQRAIDSGARRVLLRAGRYAEAFRLVSGVEVVGAGADATIIEAPITSSGGALVTAEGIVGARLARLSIVGDGQRDGVRVEDGARDVTIQRVIIRTTRNAVALSGQATDVELVNNTIISNTVGINATNCAGFDLRNTVFAYTTRAALSYQRCAPAPLIRYNAYWKNGRVAEIDGTPATPAEPGRVVTNPRFTNRLANNYRPLPGSPLLDAGNPSDPRPPNTGGRVDIGYVQQGRAAIYVDDSYCDPLNPPTGQACENDGLDWGVDAFNRIQTALDAAALDVQASPCTAGQSCYLASVSVGPGTYTESLRVPSRVRLVGSGAERTLLVRPGSAPRIADISGAEQVELRGFSLLGAGGEGLLIANGTRAITVSQNIVRNATVGVRINAASAEVSFNTFVQNSGAAIRAEQAPTLARIDSNIIVISPVGIEAQAGARAEAAFNLLNAVTQPFGAAGGATITQGDGNSVGVDPRFVNPAANDYRLQRASPAVDAGNWLAPARRGGGDRSDIGYRELTGVPLTLLLGKEGVSCQVGNAGVAGLDVGLARVADASAPLTSTLPTNWVAATLDTPGSASSSWLASIQPAADGLYRLYTRARDAAGNRTGDKESFRYALIVDGSAPIVTLPDPGSSTGVPAIALTASVSDYVDVGGTARFNVDRILFEVNGQRYPASWQAGSWSAASGQERRFEAVVPLAAGANTIVAVAVDAAGNEGRSAPRTLTSSATNHSATVTSLENGAVVAATTLSLGGVARFTNTSGTPIVQVQLNNGQPLTATLAAPSALISDWSLPVTLRNGVNLLDVRAGRTAGGFGPSSRITVTVDLDRPQLSVLNPPANAAIGFGALMSGTAADPGSGVVGVEVSLDGGQSWLAASLNGQNWSVPIATEGLQARIGVQVRARDRAGNQATVSHPLIVDTAPPTGLEPVTFSVPPGRYLDAPQSLTVNWTPAVDAGSAVSTRAAINQGAVFTPTQTSASTMISAPLNAAGAWYTHLNAVDAAGNQLAYTYGPWYVNTLNDATCSARRKVVTLDGLLDLPNGEWRAAGELLDDDERSPATRNLFANWDAQQLYLAVQGASWPINGALVAYLDTGSGGATQPLSGYGTGSLPLAADYALVITSATAGTLYQATAGGWQPSALPWSFAVGKSGGTEIRLPLGATIATGEVGLLAAVIGSDGAPTSVFPTSNALAGPWTTSYRWASLCGATTPNANQPQTKSATLELASPQGASLVGPNGSIEYVVAVTNNERDEPLTGLELELAATGGLSYQQIGGVACSTCTAGATSWTIALPPLAVGATTQFTVSARLAASLSADAATTSGTLQLPGLGSFATLAQRAVTSRIDSQPPTIAFDASNPPSALPGQRTITGGANDGAGSGVARVEVRLPGASDWQPASGTSLWQAEVTIPGSGSYSFDARAIDAVGNIGAPVRYTVVADGTPPVATLTLPRIVSDTTVIVQGSGFDPFPSNGAAVAAEVQIADPTNAWTPVDTLVQNAGTLTATWQYNWSLPPLDGVPLGVRARVRDLVGNLSAPTAWQTATVDTVAPLLTATQSLTQVVGSFGAMSMLSGAVSDGGGLALLEATTWSGGGVVATERITPAGGQWSYTPPVTTVGQYRVQLRAVDNVGNRTETSFYSLDVIAAPSTPTPTTPPIETATTTATSSPSTTATPTATATATSSPTTTATPTATATASPTAATPVPITATLAYGGRAGVCVAGDATSGFGYFFTVNGNNPGALVVTVAGTGGGVASAQVLTVAGQPTLRQLVVGVTPLSNQVQRTTLTVTLTDGGTTLSLPFTVMVGTMGADLGTTDAHSLRGSKGVNLIVGLGGDDLLWGGNGDDLLCGGSGTDAIDGGNGNDTISGGDGNDILAGSSGADTISGDDGNDTLFGQKGNDTLTGGPGGDHFDGGSGTDTATDFNPSEGDTKIDIP